MRQTTNPGPGTSTGGLLLGSAPLAMVLLWSTGFIGTKLSLPFGEPFTLLFWRFATTALVMTAFCLTMRVAWPRDPRALAAMALIGILVHAVFLSGSYLAVDRGVSTGIVALIVGLQPILTAIVAGPVFGEQVSRRQVAGLLLGFGGVALVVSSKFTFGSQAYFGAGYAVMSLFGMTAGTLLQKRFGGNVDLRSAIVVQTAASALVIGLLAMLFETTSVRWTPAFLAVHIWLVFGCSIGAVVLTYLLIRADAIARVASLFYLIAPLVALMGYFLFGETLDVAGVFGMAVAVIGVMLVVRPSASGR